jgi:NAD(P)-dependent dehydrogenase (short-subunit alcohol dehydrogenase family)
MRILLVIGSEGILGREIVKSLLEEQENFVMGFDRNESRFTESTNYSHFKGSVSNILDLVSFERLIALKQEQLGLEGDLKAIINCFAEPDYKVDDEYMPKDFNEYDRRIWAWRNYPAENFVLQLTTNLVGVHNVLQILFPRYAKSSSCSIVNFSSQYGIKVPNQELFEGIGHFTFKPPAYSSSKAALINYTEYLAILFGGTNIRVNSIAPGNVFTTQNKKFVENYSRRTITGRMMRASEIVAPVKFLISDDSLYMNGSCLIVDGGWTVK